MVKKIFFINVLFFILVFFVTSIKAQELIPQPGVSCGVGTVEENMDVNKPENFKYRCCYSSLENWRIKISNPLKDLEIPVLENIFDFFVNRLNDFPFIFWPFPGNATFSFNGLNDLLVNTYKNFRCEKGAQMKGKLGEDCFCKIDNSQILYSLASFCDNVNDKEKSSCFDCIGYNPQTKEYKGSGGVYTAIGCLKADLGGFIRDNVFRMFVGLAGVISLFCIIYAAFQLQTSQGSAEKIKKAQELLTSCIMGLMLIIFSIFILKLIGVDILKIPGFSK